jgi:S-DNA-T family DNA segregation ATPase FtsK/SpoIIIE
MVVSLLAGPLAVRGDAAATAGCLRWLLAQAVTRHRARDVCLACAVAPHAEENWLWLNWLPHARPGNPPVVGPHVATAVDAAADLVARLGGLAAARAEQASRLDPAHRLDPADRLDRADRADLADGEAPIRVLAVLDSRLGLRPDDARLADAHRHGLHVVHLLDAGDAAPGMSTLDLSTDMTWCRLTRAEHDAAEEGVPDAVGAAYPRDLAELLPDD